MRYTVLWTPVAEQRLAEVWLDAENPGEVNAAARAIDAMLREDAHLVGESRSGSVRIMFVSPLAVNFEVLPNDRLVHVLSLWMPEPRSK